MRRIYLHAAASTADLVEASSRAVSRAELVWREARRIGDFALLLPHLSQVLTFQQQIGQAKGEALGCRLMTPSSTATTLAFPGAIDPLFAPLGAELPALIQEAQERQKGLPAIQPLEAPSLLMTNAASASS